MRIRTLALAGAAIAAVAYLFDPVRGRDRRQRLEHTVRSLMGRPTTRTEPPALLPENLAPRPPAEGPPPTEPVGRVEPTTRTEPTERIQPQPIREPIPMSAGSRPERPSRSPEDIEVVHRVQESRHARQDLRADDLVVDVVNGVAYLSGDLQDSHTFGEIVDLTGRVPGVRRVQSLLHLPDSETVSRGISSRRVGDEGR
jgi:BON domain